MSRTVWLGRKPLFIPGTITHWAVKVGNIWYEVDIESFTLCGTKENKIVKSYGKTATSGAGPFGGEPVGKTSKTDREIDRFNNDWLSRNTTYNLIGENCQKHAIEFIQWLTNGRYRLSHLPDGGDVDVDLVDNTIAYAEDDHAFAHAHAFKAHGSYGVLSTGVTALSVDVEIAAADSGVGAWVNASLIDAEATIGPVGVHAGPNINTGVGVRQGNLDVHILGFGGKIGTDGVSVDTPLGGANCSVM